MACKPYTTCVHHSVPLATNSLRWVVTHAFETVRRAHGRLANELVECFDTIILPEFMTKNMLRRWRREQGLSTLHMDQDAINQRATNATTVLHKKTRKTLVALSHYQFRQRLLAKYMVNLGKVKDYLITLEEFTMVQCPRCSALNFIGIEENYRCKDCDYRGLRGSVAPFNIFCRAVTKGEVAVRFFENIAGGSSTFSWFCLFVL